MTSLPTSTISAQNNGTRSHYQLPTPERKLMPRNWFSTDSFDELHIFAPEALARQNLDALPALVVRERAFIERLVERIESIDPEGDLMKKPGPNTEVLRLVFCTSGKPEEGVEFFNGSIKTPSTGFHSSGPTEGAAIYEELLGLLNPDVE